MHQYKYRIQHLLKHRVYTLCGREKLRRYTCILSIRNARHNACRAFRTISCKGAIGRAVIGGYIRGILRRIGAQRIAAQSPLYALFFPPLSFSRKKKVVKNEQLKYLSIYLDRGSAISPLNADITNNYITFPNTIDRGSAISSPLTQTKQLTTSPFQLLLTAAAKFDLFET